MTQGTDPTVDTMYLVLPVPFRQTDGHLYVEAQAANGLDRWADNFSRLTAAAPLIPEASAERLEGFVWRRVDTLEHASRIVCQPLPYAYNPVAFLKSYRATRDLIAASIAASRHLQFAIGGLIGDWAAIAALEAIRQKRLYAIHTDRVEHEVQRETSRGSSLPRRLKAAVEIPIMRAYHHHVIQHCSLGLWHGDDCYRAYAPWSRQNHLVHDVHTKQTDLIDEPTLRRKLQNILDAPTLEICYVGRLDPMKAPLEWLQAIAVAREQGANLRATWYGEGSLLDAARAEATRLNLNDIVNYPGFVADRPTLLQHLSSTHVLVFTHVTPESPRNLLEAFVSGTAILGYNNAYAVNLIEDHGGGEVVPLHDTAALGKLIASFARDRASLATLTRQAAENGRRFTDAGVFTERSQLLKQYA